MDDSAALSGHDPVEPFSVFLLDDHEIVRRGAADLIGAEPDITVVGEANRRSWTRLPTGSRTGRSGSN